MNRGRYRWGSKDLLHKIADMPHEAWHWLKAKASLAAHEKKLLWAAHKMDVQMGYVEALTKRLRWRLDVSTAGESPKPLTSLERELLKRIERERDAHNRNNVARTAAYLNIYREHRELHWALLAHLVSRNGGWCMTDLKGELLPLLLNVTQREAVFAFLERANALIFRDAYPQLLLYRASLQHQRPLFHLLPQLGVSAFMRPVWELFWERRDSVCLTIGLIVNEQHHIEQRVVQHPVFRHSVIETLFFQAQSLLQLNQVVFPYVHNDRIRMAGLILENFSNVQERIEIGKKLYAILFGIPVVFEGAKRFAFSTRHSGSRADYWPHLFSCVRKQSPVLHGQLQERLDGCRLRPGAVQLFSPNLLTSWKDRPVAPPEPGDWFQDMQVVRYFASIEAPFSFEMTQEYCFGLSKIELAVLAGDLLV
ncbi:MULTISPECIES: DUF2515 family protein [unclassified Paenibacillus]|uniref:DUF2515 family protein n=1 Tax=unclassified Paenibacillus TaxID=185978 RepID=UPI001AE6582A|nr:MULTISPECIES: DUF2515 family protein [unclassified Paenibacillus]MBP1154354.1 hypothetical protein [Paenibacillus sp. PvP091]MBP1170262.1 hypothetical protein [Paenibacillus sp. PvR098]MBP2441290.1 hypothetical protein [Paenibacillus sp. PvP052]